MGADGVIVQISGASERIFCVAGSPGTPKCEAMEFPANSASQLRVMLRNTFSVPRGIAHSIR